VKPPAPPTRQDRLKAARKRQKLHEADKRTSNEMKILRDEQKHGTPPTLTNYYLHTLMDDPEYVQQAILRTHDPQSGPEQIPCLPWAKATQLDEWCATFLPLRCAFIRSAGSYA